MDAFPSLGFSSSCRGAELLKDLAGKAARLRVPMKHLVVEGAAARRIFLGGPWEIGEIASGNGDL